MSLLIDQESDLCRICVKHSFHWRNLYEIGEDGQSLAQKIFICTRISVNEQDNRPSRICSSCAILLDSAYNFYNLVKNSEIVFLNLSSSTCDSLGPTEVLCSSHQSFGQSSEDLEEVKIKIEVVEPALEEPVRYRLDIYSAKDHKYEYDDKLQTNRVKVKQTVAISKRKKETKTFECYKCGKEFTTYWKTSLHLKQHDTERKYKCAVCGVQFTFWHEYNRHLCQGEQIQCAYCCVAFEATRALLNHLDNCNAEKTLFKCDKCGQFYSMELLKEYHMSQHDDKHAAESKPFVCKVCKKGFGSKSALKSHEEIHSDAKPFLCPECGKRFKTNANLRCHKIGHNDKTMKCPDCPKTFNRISCYRMHRETHFQLKYKCNICHAELKTKDGLECHTRKHRLTDDDKRHQCTFCPKKFFKKDNLNRHMRTHTGEKPFKCTDCPDRTYAQKGDLIKHIKQKHVGNKVYSCDMCGEGFEYFADLKTHSFKHYKEDKTKLDEISNEN